MVHALRTLLRFLILSSLLIIPTALWWQGDGGSIWPVLEWDRGWYGLVLSALVRRPQLDVLMFYGDVPLLFVAVIAAVRFGLPARIAAWLGGFGFVLMALFGAYHHISFGLQHQPPMLVVDQTLLSAAQHFIADLGPEWLLGGTIAATLALLAVLAWTVRILRGLLRDSQQSTAPYLVSLGLVAYTAALTIMVGTQRSDTVGKWLAKELYHNASRSLDHIELSEQLDTMTPDDRYQQLLSQPATKTPRILVYFMESYGDILLTDARFREPFSQILAGTMTRLSDGGWHSAHGLSEAPVHGGKSWFSSASVLTGVKISYPSHYQRFQTMSGDYPHLVRWLAASGYETYGVWPATKKRPGLSNANTYDFDHYLTSAEIPYDGQSFGWGGTPDQFALGHAVDAMKAGRQGDTPQFMFYVSASSHSPWRQPPPFASHWQQAGQTAPATTVGTKEHVLNALNNRLRRTFNPQTSTGNGIGEFYVPQIGYQWQVLEQVATDPASPFDLIVVVGDHQPPLLVSRDGDQQEPSFRTPIHILAKDKSIIATALAGGFAPTTGGILSAEPIRHEGIYQLMVDILSAKQSRVAARPWRKGATLGAFKF